MLQYFQELLGKLIIIVTYLENELIKKIKPESIWIGILFAGCKNWPILTQLSPN